MPIGAIANNVAKVAGAKGVVTNIGNACAASTISIEYACDHIRAGVGDVFICGGTDTFSSLAFGGFTALHALDTEPCSPYNKSKGITLGEGAGALIVESYEHAVARGAKIYCEVVGYGSNCDAHHMTAPLEDGSGAAKCMEAAIKDAGIKPEDIVYINAHGTSTPLNDKGETKAIKLAFGDYASNLMISSTKAMTGHLLGASGGVEGVITALSINNNYVPATINYKEQDENCDLDIVPNKGRNTEIAYAMSNSLGFGGHNASVVFKKYA